MDQTYDLLRHLTSPIVAITSRRGDEVNGMIANSAARASLSKEKPRVSVYIHKFNYSHDMIFESGRFVMHILGEEDLATVDRLGFASRRDGAKMQDVTYSTGKLGLPILDDCYCYFECDVVNVMDTGGSTLFLGAVQHTERGNREHPMTPTYMREAISDDRRREYIENLAVAQRHATERADEMRTVIWPGLSR